MLDGLVESMAAATPHTERKFVGIAVAQVIGNMDSTNAARVQIKLPWLPDFEPWARVATLMAGPDRGTYFVPQVGDEVLVAFNQGDVRDPFILGSLWNGQDNPPATDPESTRMIRTPVGHSIVFDDKKQTITISTNNQHTITIGPDKIVVSTAQEAASLTLDATGKVSLQAKVSIEIKAPQVTISGTTVEISGDASAKLEGKGMCTVKGGMVAIN